MCMGVCVVFNLKKPRLSMRRAVTLRTSLPVVVVALALYSSGVYRSRPRSAQLSKAICPK
jgi:hypothetical protein